MKLKELKQRSDKELKETLSGLRDKLRELRFNLSGGRVKNIREIHQTKKTIARILTLLKEYATLRPGATGGHPKGETDKK
ncbi:MAG: 50S ribosomal protein L29 [Candidatus Portnoybacteria bacterium CG10_big_fil_rev_8_21_14_0_10_38_18]|uniref:Large ribosomal subunit protein uL29 n=1 Tax=Candidatus Portnoybacteria bacterium CG10_big_fil_rev_8_21_14_0_10_38_18 TaxID=1974813 RepID=A0A2M8KCI2_9BACT|nr:MAG: 50S ribosomal protein L29 [Candidatus Portnoybacteria bacterium CG10_big_fil_rev_8_21_14_0_10_38_18]